MAVSSFLVGRDRELAAVRAVWTDLPRGPAAVLIAGAPGVGKTTLAEAALADAAERGYQVLTARPSEAEADRGYGCLTDLFAEVLDEAGPGLSPIRAKALSVALLEHGWDGTGADSAQPPVWLVCAAVLDLVRQLARSGPLVLAIDDLQWADAGSRRVLGFLARRLRDRPVGMLLTSRPWTTASTPLDLDRAPNPASVLRLDGLTGSALQRLIAERLGVSITRATASRIADVTDGNPLFAVEMARALGDTTGPGATQALGPRDPLPVPADLGDLLHNRINVLPDTTRQLLVAVAVLGLPTTGELTSVLAKVSEHQTSVRRDTEKAARAGILHRRGDRWAFTHPLLASVVSRDATEDLRRACHRAAARVRSGAEQRARHLALATEGPDEDVARQLEQAATVAHRRGAPEAAAHLADLAVNLTPAADLVASAKRLGDTATYLFLAGDLEAAGQCVDRAVEIAPDGPPRARALLVRGRMLLDARSSAEALPVLEAALRASGADQLLAAAAHGEIAEVLYTDWQHAEQHAAAAVRLVGDVNAHPAIGARALSMVAQAQAALGKGLHVGLFDRASQLEKRAPARLVASRAVFTKGAWLNNCDRLTEAAEPLAAARNAAVDEGDEASLPIVLFPLGRNKLWAGEWPAAEELAAQADESAQRVGLAAWRGAILAIRGMIAAHRGEPTISQQHLRAGMDIAIKENDARALAFNQHSLGFLALSIGDFDAAEGYLAAAHRFELRRGMVAQRCIADYVEILIRLGRLEDAESVLSTAGDLPWLRAISARYRGMLYAARDELETAVEEFTAALRLHRPLGMPFEEGRTLFELGRAQRRAKRRADARASLTDALEIFERLGAPPWALATSAELERIPGSRPATPTLRLTPTEERIATLVCDGLTNSQIAMRIFLSTKTVEANLSRIYRKVGVRSRVQLARTMAP